jgi:hypothetical protein
MLETVCLGYADLRLLGVTLLLFFPDSAESSREPPDISAKWLIALDLLLLGLSGA